MNNKRNLKPFVLILVLLFLLVSCRKKDNQGVTPDDMPLDELNPSPTISEDNNQDHSEEGLFSDVSSYEIEQPKTFIEETRNFSVNYPEAWETHIDDGYTGSPDGSPDSGIYIYINSNKDDWIYIYGQNGHIGGSMYGPGSEEFSTGEDVPGRFKYYKSDGRIHLNLVLDEEFNGAALDSDEDVFNDNKQQILGILKSIKLDYPWD